MNKETSDIFEILRKIVKDPSSTQRDLANELNLSPVKSTIVSKL